MKFAIKNDLCFTDGHKIVVKRNLVYGMIVFSRYTVYLLKERNLTGVEVSFLSYKVVKSEPWRKVRNRNREQQEDIDHDMACDHGNGYDFAFCAGTFLSKLQS